MASTRVSALRLLKNRNFALLWLGQTISFTGDYFYWLAIQVMVYQLTGSALMVGLSVIASALPMLLLGPIAGVFVDRWDRRRTMIVADVARGLLVLLCLLVRSADQVWIYYVASFLLSCVSRFFFPAQNAALPLIVQDKDDLLAANGLMQAVQTVTLILGSGLAGLAIGFLGAGAAFAFDAVTFFLSAGTITLMVVPRTTGGRRAVGGQIAAVWGEIREGVACLFGSQTMVGVLICLAAVQLGIGAINVVWVPFFQGTFGVGPEGLGVVDLVQGVGMGLGALVLGLLAARLRKSMLAGWSIAVIGLLVGGIGLIPQFGYVIPLSFGIGLALVPGQAALMTMMQLAVPDLKRGRVGSALNALTTLAGLLSMAAAAGFGEMIGLRTVYLVCGAIVALSGLLAFRIREPAPLEEGPRAVGPMEAGAVEEESERVRVVEPIPVSPLVDLEHGGVE